MSNLTSLVMTHWKFWGSFKMFQTFSTHFHTEQRVNRVGDVVTASIGSSGESSGEWVGHGSQACCTIDPVSCPLETFIPVEFDDVLLQ